VPVRTFIEMAKEEDKIHAYL
jgi:esterase/lipase